MTLNERFWSKVIVQPGSCWLWTAGRGGHGYGLFSIARATNMGAHRFAWLLARGPIPDGLCVLHRCDRRTCVNPDHLFLGSRGENNTDRSRKGRSAIIHGERRYNAHLTEELVMSIRADHTTSHAEMGRRLGVSGTTISNIRNGRRWQRTVAARLNQCDRPANVGAGR